jgi:hypothetical protein
VGLSFFLSKSVFHDCVCVDYCRTNYKAVRVGGGGTVEDMCYERLGPVRNPVLSDRVAPCFPWFLSFGNRTQISRVAGARPNHQPIGGSDPNHQGIWVKINRLSVTNAKKRSKSFNSSVGATAAHLRADLGRIQPSMELEVWQSATRSHSQFSGVESSGSITAADHER